MKNPLAGILPQIVEEIIMREGKGAQKFKAGKIILKYDRRHNNKRDLKWWMKKTGFRLKEWWEHIG